MAFLEQLAKLRSIIIFLKNQRNRNCETVLVPVWHCAYPFPNHGIGCETVSCNPCGIAPEIVDISTTIGSGPRPHPSKFLQLHLSIRVCVEDCLHSRRDVIQMLSNPWRVWKGKGRWGGKRKRDGWEGMRRAGIERLLVTQRGGRQIESQNPLLDSIINEDGDDARSTGLLFLSLSRLQAYASRYLPLVIRQAFLEDLEDLANPQLATRAEKLLVVSRV